VDSIEGEFNGDLAKELSLGDLRQAEEIMIQTANSIYSFSVTDPVERRGILSGGVLEGLEVNAAFAGSVMQGEGNSYNFLSGLKTGTRALFYIEFGSGVKRLCTSAITDLIYLRL
jgi:hypothetical protein